MYVSLPLSLKLHYLTLTPFLSHTLILISISLNLLHMQQIPPLSQYKGTEYWHVFVCQALVPHYVSLLVCSSVDVASM